MRIRKLGSLLVVLSVLLAAVRFTATAALDEPNSRKPTPDRIPSVSMGPRATAPIEPSTQPPYALISTSSASTRTDIETSTIIAGEGRNHSNYPMACVWVELVNEDFETWAPTDWSIVNNGGDCVWRAGSTGDDDNYTGSSGDYADADSDECGLGSTMDSDLQTPHLDLSTATSATLQFKSDMLWYFSDVWDVDLSLDGGTSWPTNLLHRSGQSYPGPETITLPLTGAAGENDVRVRFRYQGAWDYWWQVDEVVISACIAPEPGLYLTPDTIEVDGCAAVTQTHTFNLNNQTGSAGTFSLTYAVPSGNATISGPPNIALANDTDSFFDVQLTPDECLPQGSQVIATVDAAGNSFSDQSLITETITGLGKWQYRNVMPNSGRGDMAVVASGDGIYAIGGYAYGGGPPVVTNERYDVPSDSWAAMAALPSGLAIIDGGEIGGIVYVPGGYNGTDITTTVYAYDTGADSWGTVAAAPRPVAGYGVAACGGLLYRVGGAELATWPSGTTAAEVYDPGTDSWGPLPAMSAGHTWPAAGCLNGKIYVAGGFDETGGESTITEVYDIATGSWSDANMSDLPETWWGAADLGKHNMLYLIGGSASGHATDKTIIYDPAKDSWSYGASLQDTRFRLEGDYALGTPEPSGYAIGGWNPLWTAHDSNEYLYQCPECAQVGWLNGHVMDSETGDVDPTCTQATVHIEPGSTDVTVDPATGYYWTDAFSGTYAVEATATGYSLESAVVDVTTDITTVLNLDLWRPVVEILPQDFLSYTAYISNPITYTLTITNRGHLPLDFEIRELPPPLVGSGIQRSSGIQVEPELQSQMAANGAAGYLIYFRNRPDLSTAFQMDWSERGWFVMDSLRAAANRAQARVRAYLDAHEIEHQSFWIDNVIMVERSHAGILNELMNYPEIAALRAKRTMHVIEPVDETSAGPITPQVIEANISHVNADQVWGLGYRGEGIVVANIDTGVRYTHEVLEPHYRGSLGGGSYSHDYNWLDPDTGNTIPTDDYGHGSHTMGTMIGDDDGTNQVGMAPGAQWIACDACNVSTGCPDAALLTCAQWIAAPYPIGDSGAANPDLRPHVVNNSWGDCARSYDNWYQGSVNSWHAAGIYPVFSNGNASNCEYPQPPGCDTVGNPARYGNVTGVGSTGQQDGQYATHSNWGPTDDPDAVNPDGYPSLKPQIMAPGVNIRSSLNGSDSDYGSWGGTSMSAPHVSGLIALLWQAAPCLVGDYATTETILQQTAVPIPYASDCGGEGPGNVPNMATGWGEIDALAAVQQAQQICSTDWLPWVWEYPITGTIPSTSSLDIDVTFHCTDTRDYAGTLRLSHNDPCEPSIDIPINLHCTEQPMDTPDLGDAPTSFNNWGSIPMTANDGVLASYPTVFGVPTPTGEVGPKHINAGGAPAWLGPTLTWEFDADIPPDQDLTTNISPTIDLPNLDGADDGVWIPPTMNHCVADTVLVTVTVAATSPPPLFINAWFDWARNGDWADVLTCSTPGDTHEWAVQDMPFNPPGPGVYQVPLTIRPWNPTDAPVWVRVTLAEQVAPAPQIGNGPVVTGYAIGETEDYLYTPPCVSDVTIEPPADALSGDPGTAVVYTLWVTNTGNCTESYDLTSSGETWTTTLPSTVGPLNLGQDADVDVVVDIPVNAVGGNYDVATIMFSSQANPLISESSVLTTTALCVPVSGADLSYYPVQPRVGKTVTFTGTVASGEAPITYTWNLGDGTSPLVGNPIAYTFTVEMTYTVVMTASNGCPSADAASYDLFVASGSSRIYLPIVLRN